MKLNLSLLSHDASPSDQVVSEGVSTVPMPAEMLGRHLKAIPGSPVPAFPAASRLSRDSKTQQRQGLPAVPVFPAQNSNVTGNVVPAGLASLSAANDCRHAGPLVLTFELDEGMATCIDPVSASLTEAVADIRRQFPGRVGRVWMNESEVSVP